MLRRVFVVGLFFSVAFVPAMVWARDPSDALLSTLTALRNLNVGFSFVVDWSSNPKTPSSPFSDYEKAEEQIMDLGDRDRDAVLFWLQSHGRQRLYDRGASDDQIGPSRFPIDTFVKPVATATPVLGAGWHKLPFIAGALGAAPVGAIAISSGFSSVKDDATAEVHCVSFTNTSPKTARSIAFGYQFLDKQRNVLASLTSVRTGTFSSDVRIDGPKDFPAYLTAGSTGGPRTLKENCWRNDVGTATLALLQARYFTFHIKSVTYADGSVFHATPP